MARRWSRAYLTDQHISDLKEVELVLNRILFPVDTATAQVDFIPSPEEAMYLLAAAWLHDIGMVYGIFSDEDALSAVDLTEIRETHEQRSARYITQQWSLNCDWTASERMYLAELCICHRQKHPLSKMLAAVQGRGNSPVRLRELAALLRIADECHLVTTRTHWSLKSQGLTAGLPVESTLRWLTPTFVHSVDFDNVRRVVRFAAMWPSQGWSGRVPLTWR